jgi:hypothetical protein
VEGTPLLFQDFSCCGLKIRTSQCDKRDLHKTRVSPTWDSKSSKRPEHHEAFYLRSEAEDDVGVSGSQMASFTPRTTRTLSSPRRHSMISGQGNVRNTKKGRRARPRTMEATDKQGETTGR